jgi:6-pyruvoyltetrahydropterin/6-carboxytetrahydropterin synthase
MFTLCVRDVFSAAHRLENYGGKCEQLHGHNFRVEAFFAGEDLNSDGMLVDFTLLKSCLKEVLSALDHKHLNDISFFQARASSSEYIAMFIFGELEKILKAGDICVKEVRVWESDNAFAAFGR